MAQIDSIKQEADQLKIAFDKGSARKEEVSEEKKDLTENLKRL